MQTDESSIGGLGAGAVTNANPEGWRDIFWIQAGLHGFTALGLLLFYWPKKRTDYPKMTFWEGFWAVDPIGSLLFVSSATLMLLALNWAGGTYHWSNPHVAVPLSIGLGLLVAFGIYGEEPFSRGCTSLQYLTSSRMERPRRRYCRSRFLPKWPQLLPLYIRLRS
jgi:hypothetical protein